MSRNRERLNEPGTIVVFFNNIFIFHMERPKRQRPRVTWKLQRYIADGPSEPRETPCFENVNKPPVVLNFVLTDKWLK